MSYKTPNIIPIPNPVLLDELIQEIQQDFQANLPWLEYAFGRAKPFNDKGFIEPRVYYGQTTAKKEGEYYSMLPNDYWKSHCFFVSDGPQSFLDYENIPNSRNIWSRPISMIFWVDLYKIDSTINSASTEPLIFDVLTRIKQFRHIQVLNIIDNSAIEVYQGFNIQDTSSENFAYPFTGFRILCNLSGYEQCITMAIIIPDPTDLIATTFSSSQIDLIWTDNGGGIYAFEISRGESLGGPFAVIFTTNPGDTSYNDNTGLNPSTEYFYRVRATDGTNFSGYSNIANATTNSLISDEVQAALNLLPNPVIQSDIDKITAIVNAGLTDGSWPTGNPQVISTGRLEYVTLPLSDPLNSATSLIGSKNDSTIPIAGIPVDNPTYIPGTGRSFDGTSSYVNLNFDLSTDLTNADINTLTIVAHVAEGRDSGFKYLFGVFDGTNFVALRQTSGGGGLIQFIINSTAFANSTAGNFPFQDNTTYGVIRPNSSTAILEINGVVNQSANRSIVGIPSGNLFLGAHNNNGSADFFIDATVSFLCIGVGDLNPLSNEIKTQFGL